VALPERGFGMVRGGGVGAQALVCSCLGPKQHTQKAQIGPGKAQATDPRVVCWIVNAARHELGGSGGYGGVTASRRKRGFPCCEAWEKSEQEVGLQVVLTAEE
jgi:hypothetical protein